MTMALDISTYISSVNSDGQKFAELAERSMDRSIPSCPKWNGADLVYHLGRVHYMFTDVLARSVTDTADLLRVERPDDAALLQWYRDGVSSLVRTMTNTPRGTPAWSFFGPNTADWVVRRLAHETAVHAWDIADATGASFDIDLELASDGIDEFLNNFLIRPHAEAGELGGSVHIHCTDVDGEWMIQPASDGSLDISWGHGKGDCALRGTANDVLLALWHRRPLTALEIIGDHELATRFVNRAQR